MSLASLDDLDLRAVTDIDDLDRANTLLADVSAAVQLYTGQKFEQDDYTLRTRVRRRKVVLPQRPVNTVDSVTDRFENEVDYTWDGIDTIYIESYTTIGSAPLQVVDVTYNAGPETVPEPIVGVVANIALRALGIDPMDAAITQESVDGYAFTIGSTGASGSYGVLPAEAKILNQYKGRRNIGSIAVAW